MIKRFLDKSRKVMSNNSGFTLIEILVVIFIIGILFVAFLPRIDFAGDKARETNVRTDVRSYLIANEQLMKEQSGLVDVVTERSKIDLEETKKQYNLLLDASVRMSESKKTGEDNEYLLNLNDPWKTPYTVEFATGSTEGTERKIIIKSYGKNLKGTGDDTPDYILVTQYIDGQVLSCTAGLNTNIGKMTYSGTELKYKEDKEEKSGFLVPDSKLLNCN